MMGILVNSSQSTINRTLKTSVLVDAFWDRWIVHGIEKSDIISVRSSLTTLERWVELWSHFAEEKEGQARKLIENGEIYEAEILFRKASLYFNLIQWIYPAPEKEKQEWYERSLSCTQEADHLSSIKTLYVKIKLDHHFCFGRIRTPSNPIGCIIIFNPIDSSKEELYTYETDFINQGMITVSFDSPGQGETFIRQEFKRTQSRLYNFVDEVIKYTRKVTKLPIYLFGTSLGAAWAIYGSCHPEVTKTVAVSPTAQRAKLALPAYFIERANFFSDESEAVPNYDDLSFHSPVVIYQGGKDGMVPTSFTDHLFNLLPAGKKLVLFAEEGHCCNYKLDQIRRESLQWFLESANNAK